jgi:transposase
MDRQTLRDWVHRYDELGLEGLRNRGNPGAPPRKLTQEQETQLAEWVRRGPELERHKIVRWRLVDLRDEIACEFGVEIHERTVGKIMARLKFRRVSVRPRHPDQDVAAQEAHKKTSLTSSLPSFPSMRVESPVRPRYPIQRSGQTPVAGFYTAWVENGRALGLHSATGD